MTALLLIDLQRGMCDDDGPAGAAGLAAAVRDGGVLDVAATVLAHARANKWDITHVHLEFEAGYGNRTNRSPRFNDHEAAGRFRVGSTESQFRAEVAPLPDERVISKGSVSPFASTGLLESYLARREEELVIVGVATHLAVESAAREATDRGLSVVVLSDGCAAPAPAVHEHSISVAIPSFARVVSSSEYLAGVTAP